MSKILFYKSGIGNLVGNLAWPGPCLTLKPAPAPALVGGWVHVRGAHGTWVRSASLREAVCERVAALRALLSRRTRPPSWATLASAARCPSRPRPPRPWCAERRVTSPRAWPCMAPTPHHPHQRERAQRGPGRAQVGTPYYLAPEIIQGLGYDFSADMQSAPGADGA